MIESVGLAIAGVFLGSEPASTLVMAAFLLGGSAIAAAPLVLGLALYPRLGFNRLAFGVALTVASFLLGMSVALAPVFHAAQFGTCEDRVGVYREVLVTEIWCATRESLDDEFGEMKFYGFRAAYD